MQIKLVEIAQEDLDELAFNWQYAVNASRPNWKNGQLSSTTIIQPSSNELLRYYVPGESTGSTALSDANYSWVWANNDGTKISAHMFALDWADSKDVLASPRITTVPGYSAHIEMVTKRYFPDSWENIDFDTLSTYGNLSGFSITSISPQPDLSKEQDLGVIFDIKPELVGADMIKMKLHFPITTFADEWITYDYRLAGADNDDDDYISEPIFNTRTFDTTVMLHDGETILFGGVNNDHTTIVNDKIPILGDLPFIGRFFQSKYSKSSKNNLLIFITARLVKPDGSAFFPDRQLARGVPEFGNID